MKVFINTKRYTVKKLFLFTYGLYVDDTLLEYGGVTSITEQCKLLNNVYVFAVTETVSQLNCDYEFIK